LVDRFGRCHNYLRVSVTDRCNFKCTYCMPSTGVDWMPKSDVLSFEEIERIVGVFASMGVRAVRLTGGEPTIRRHLEKLISALAGIDGIDEVTLTTNGHVFAKKAALFAESGLRRVNISLDTLDPVEFKRLSGGGEVTRVLDSISAARKAGLTPIKINTVVVADQNEDLVEDMVEQFLPHAHDTVIRFIEYMPFGVDSRRHVPAATLRERLSIRYTMEPVEKPGTAGPAVYWRIASAGLVVGFISAMSEHFCKSCNRLRLMADGHLRTCLSRDKTPSLRDLLRSGATNSELKSAIRGMVWNKVEGHEAHLQHPFEGVMTQVGG
jgi:GTP 3',8-cyclase